MVGQFELAFRVGTAVFVIVTPTVLFLGLWRGLELMRDDEIIARARQEGYVSSSPTTERTIGSVLPDAADETATPTMTGSGSATATATCDACGASNIPEAVYCQECLEELD